MTAPGEAEIAAIRAKLNVTAANTAVLTPIIDALDGLNLLGLASLENVSLGAEVLNLELYADVARAEGTIGTVNALASTVSSSSSLAGRPLMVSRPVGS